MAVVTSAKKFWEKTPLSGKGFLIKGVYRQKGLNQVFGKFLADADARKEALLRLVENAAPSNERAKAASYAKELLKAGKDSELWDAVRGKVSMRHEVGSRLSSTFARHEGELGSFLYNRYIAPKIAERDAAGRLIRRPELLMRAAPAEMKLLPGGPLAEIKALGPGEEIKKVLEALPAKAAEIKALEAGEVFELPKRLRGRKSAKLWGIRLSQRWAEEDKILRRIYKNMGKEIPVLTGHYLGKKLELGERIAALKGKGWRKSAKSAFDEIAGIRGKPLYPWAMLPFQAMKADRYAYFIKNSADMAAKTQADPRKAYRRMIKGLAAEERRLSEESKKLAEFRKLLYIPEKRKEVLDEMRALVGDKDANMETVLYDLNSMYRHLHNSKRYLNHVGKNVYNRFLFAETAARRAQGRRAGA